MNTQKNTEEQNLLKIVARISAIAGFVILVFAGLAYFLQFPLLESKISIISGLFIGYFLEVVNFFFLAKAISKFINFDPKSASKYAILMYNARSIISIIVIVLTIWKFEVPGVLALGVGVTVVKVTIYFEGMFGKVTNRSYSNITPDTDLFSSSQYEDKESDF